MKRLPASPSVSCSVSTIRLGFVGVICAITLHTTNEVHADEKPWRLDYRRGANAPVNCPDEAYLRTALAAKNGAPDPFSNEASRTITIELVPTPERIEARIQATNEHGEVVSEQIAHAPLLRCDQLADRIVFIMHDIMDPLTLLEPDSTQSPSKPISSNTPPLPEKTKPTDENPTPTAEKPVVPDQQAQEPKGKRWSKPRIALSLSLGASWWNAPHTAFTSVLGVGVRWSKVSVGIEGRYDRARALPVTQSILAEQLALGIAACGYHAFRPSRFYVRGCLLGDVTRLSMQTEQFHLNDSARLAVNVGVRGGAGLSLPRNWNIELYADGIMAVQQPRFEFNAQEGWLLPRFNGALRASLIGFLDVF